MKGEAYAPLLSCLVVLAALASAMLPSPDRSWHRDWHYFQHQSHVAAMAADAGVPPDYNPWHCGGTDQAENPQGLTTSPLFALVLLFGPAGGLRMAVLLLLAAGAGGMTWMLRRDGLGGGAAVAGGVLWGLLPFFSVHLSEGHVPFAGFALLPLVLGLGREAHRSAVEGATRRSAAPAARARAGWGWAAGAGAVLGVQMGFGGIYPLVFSALALGLDAAVRALRSRRLRPLRTAGLALFVASLLGLPRILPAMELLLRQPRPPLWQDGLDGGLLWDALLSRRVSVDPLPGHPYHWPEYVVYPGVAVLVLLLLGGLLAWLGRGHPREPMDPALKERARVSATTLTVAGFWLMIGDVPLGIHHVFRLLPGVGDLQVPSRFALLFLCGLCILTARAVHVLLRSGGIVRWVAVALLLAATLELGSLDHAWLRGAPTDRLAAVGPARAPERVGHLLRAPETMDLAPALRMVVGNCYEPGPHLVPPALQGRVDLPFVASRVDAGSSTEAGSEAGGAHRHGYLGAPVVVEDFAPGSLTLVPRKGRLSVILGQTWDARWRAEGGSVSRGPGGLIAVEGAGEGPVRLRYRNTTRPKALAVQAFTAAVLLGSWWGFRRRRRKA